jgi:hypothetical protein
MASRENLAEIAQPRFRALGELGLDIVDDRQLAEPSQDIGDAVRGGTMPRQGPLLRQCPCAASCCSPLNIIRLCELPFVKLRSPALDFFSNEVMPLERWQFRREAASADFINKRPLMRLSPYGDDPALSD